MRQMLVKDPSKRPEAKEILDHPWFMLYLKNEFRDTIKELEMIPKLKNFKPPNEFIKKILGLLVKEVNNLIISFIFLMKRRTGLLII